MIASKAEIKALAFSNTFDINAVKDNVIQIVKPYIAYNVKAYISKPNHIKTGNKGAQTAQGSNEVIANVEEAKRQAMAMATRYKTQMIAYLDRTKPLLWKGEQDSDGIINKIIIF